MRKTSKLKRLLNNSDPDAAATWIYRMLVLGCLSGIALVEVGGEQTAAVELIFTAALAGFAMAVLYLVVQPLLYELEYHWETDG